MKKPFMFLVLHSIRIKFYGKIRYGFQLKKLIQIDYHVNLPTSKHWAWALTILFVYASNFNYGYSDTNWMVFSHFFIAIFFCLGFLHALIGLQIQRLEICFSFFLSRWTSGKNHLKLFTSMLVMQETFQSRCVFFSGITLVRSTDLIKFRQFIQTIIKCMHFKLYKLNATYILQSCTSLFPSCFFE